MSKVETILEEIKGLTLLEASDLVKKMEEAFGVSAAAATVVAAGGGAHETSYDVGECRRGCGRAQDQPDTEHRGDRASPAALRSRGIRVRRDR